MSMLKASGVSRNSVQGRGSTNADEDRERTGIWGR